MTIGRVPSWSGLLLVALTAFIGQHNNYKSQCDAFYLPGVNPQSFAEGDP
jgi:hypothetical protein